MGSRYPPQIMNSRKIEVDQLPDLPLNNAMAKKALVVVESPSKAKTIQKYLGRDYIVKASVGHIKDLPKSKLGVDPAKGFKPEYQVIQGKAKIIEELKKAAAKVPEIFLAPDPDREGEAIAWHIHEELKGKGKKIHRVLINAITKVAVKEALDHPQKLDTKKFNAQQARRILDRLVGYKISPLLWDKVRRGISAGRVQSVALRLVVEREVEVKAFVPEEYWQLGADFEKQKIEFTTRLFKIAGKDPELNTQADVKPLTDGLRSAEFKIKGIERKERSRKPQPPFITSRMQQEAARKLGFSAKKTMAMAQRLYEGIDLGDIGTTGLITYMRTDSTRVEPGAIKEVREFIATEYGKDFVPAEPNLYKTKKSAQDAHEAIRPTSLELIPSRVMPFLEKDEFRLYQLIWNRFIASQMTPAVLDQTAVDVIAFDSQKREICFRATGSVVKFAGFTAVYSEGHDENTAKKGQTSAEDDDEDARALKLPPLKAGDTVNWVSFAPTQHFTQPPPRFTDASLIRELEERGIGRPSTYATILSNLQDREYVEKRENKYYPSELGQVVTELLVKSFPDILNSEFTAEMENKLDQIEEGDANWKEILSDFWKPFEKTLEKAKVQMKNIKQQEVPTKVPCEKCGKHYNIRWGKMGSFLSCSQYPECKSTQDFKKDEQGEIVIVPKQYSDKKCEKCGNLMLVKSGKFGKFLACSDYPDCKSTAAIGTGIPCPSCKVGEIVERQSRFRRIFYSCGKWPACNYAMWDKPVSRPCPKCQWPILTEKVTKKLGLIEKCPQKECGYQEVIDPLFGKGEPKPEGAADGTTTA